VAAFVLLEMPNTIGSPLFEIALVLVRFDYCADRIVEKTRIAGFKPRFDSL
jgi:hypothetical protein